MRTALAIRRLLPGIVAAAAMAADLMAQAPQPSATAPGPTYEVVSIKLNTSASNSSSMRQMPGGGFVLTNGSLRTLISMAYPGLPSEPIGLPEWASNDRIDVAATASLPAMPTADDRRAMMRALLAERFKFRAHLETREQPAFDLVLARSDGRLGPGIKPSEVDCAARAAAQRAAADEARKAGTPPPPPQAFTPPAPGSAVPPCSARMSGNVAEGDMTIAALTTLLRASAGRHVVDKTGLAGSYRVRFEAPGMLFGSAPLDAAGAPGSDAPSIFTAIQEQLGLKLEPSRAQVEVLVIDSVERPTDN
jgi:uncharacterized protein (TIGR03435 family)